MRILLLTIVLFILSSCATIHYSQTKPGELKGKLIVQWVDYDKFVFIPDPNTPLTFTRFNKDKITPRVMYTDGGSIPRPLWAFRGYSPWGYAPAFIIHDWLFHMKYCQIPGNEKFTVEEAAWVLSEVMKTIMVKDVVDKFTLYTMFEAVRSPIATNLWNTGKCEQPTFQLENLEPKMQYTIEFP
jgi:hypothetical protein